MKTSSTVLILFLILFSFLSIVPTRAASVSLPDDATPIQSAIYEALQAAREANETAPEAEYLSYGNGTTLTILTYENGTQRRFKETFIIKNVTITVDHDSPLFLPINTTDEEATEYLTKIQDILMGFTFEIPRYDWSIGLYPVLGGGISIDAGFGLRLPIQIKLEYPEIMVVNRSYTLYASVKGLDWAAADYANVGLQPNENEFLCKFFFKAWAGLLVPIIDFEVNFDVSRSFSTPIGPGDSFPLPLISVPLNPLIEQIIPIIDLDPFVDIRLQIDPHLGSQKVTANWKAENGASGEGSFLWTNNNERLSFNIQSQETVAEAVVTVTQFRYWFNLFTLDFSLYVGFKGVLSALGSHEIPVYRLDLSEIIGSLDLYMGVHKFTLGTVFVTIRSYIPEVPLGTIMASAVMVFALVAYIGIPRWRRKPG